MGSRNRLNQRHCRPSDAGLGPERLVLRLLAISIALIILSGVTRAAVINAYTNTTGGLDGSVYKTYDYQSGQTVYLQNVSANASLLGSDVYGGARAFYDFNLSANGIPTGVTALGAALVINAELPPAGDPNSGCTRVAAYGLPASAASYASGEALYDNITPYGGLSYANGTDVSNAGLVSIPLSGGALAELNAQLSGNSTGVFSLGLASECPDGSDATLGIITGGSSNYSVARPYLQVTYSSGSLVFSGNSTNTTTAGQYAQFNLQIAGGATPSDYIFSFDDGPLVRFACGAEFTVKRLAPHLARKR